MPTPASVPMIDVLLPVYNGAATIEESVASLLGQTISNLRVLVINDGSTDETPRILDALCRKDARVEVIRKPNSGIVDALNLGLARASAPFVARQDADDISYPDRFAGQLSAFENRDDVIAISGSCVHIDSAGRETGSRYAPPDPDSASYDSIPSTEPYLLHPFLMVRREAFQAVGGYRYVFNAEDTDLYWRLRRRGRLLNLQIPLGKMRLHNSSVSNASVINGRIMAISSQLAAVSARRVDQGLQDLEFSRDELAAYKSAGSFQEMLRIGERDLTEEERRYFRAAAGVKLLELASGRMYEIDIEDCTFLRSLYSSFPSYRLRGRTIANWAYRATLSRLLRTCQFEKARALASLPVVGRAVVMRLM